MSPRIYCEKCGTESLPNETNCFKCGKSLTRSEDSVTSSHSDHSITSSHDLTSHSNFIIAFWRGDYDLVFSFWLIGFGLRIPFNLLAIAIDKSNFFERAQPLIAAIVGLGLLVFSVLLGIWQCVGIWNSANKHVSRGGSIIWVHLTKLFVTLGVMKSVVEISKEFSKY